MSYKLEYRTIGFGVDPASRLPTQGIEGTFFIPSYQRGYRWTSDEVTKLLDDIWESAGQRYSLQPIVVKRIGTDRWELIDGQQRLTTLWLILRFMQKGEPRYRLEYQTRPGSQDYLRQLDPAQAQENIDYFHMHQAHATITGWFTNKMGAQYQQFLADEMFRFLSTSVRVIWYEVPENEEPIPLFTRLNQGRIPLTNAELLKAVLLAEVQKKHPGRETEVAAQWDGMERDLQRDDIWGFVAPQGNRALQVSTRIDLLFDTLANKPLADARPHHTFDAVLGQAQSDGLAFWSQVVALHAQILGWFEEPLWHNKIGFLVACGRPMTDILRLAEGQGKNAFDQALKAQIKTVLNTSASDLDSTLSYESNSHKVKLQRLLLLFNIETCRESERFPFKKHTGPKWSLEHIHAQNAQDLVRAEQWETWLQEHRRALNDVQTPDNKASIGKLLADIDTATPLLHTRDFGLDDFKALAGQTLLALNDGVEEEADHSIANLALLSHEANAALSNAVFEVKRSKVLKMDRRGDYIPAATRNVFLKYYAPAERLQPHFWGDADKTAYLQEIKTKLADYLQ